MNRKDPATFTRAERAARFGHNMAEDIVLTRALSPRAKAAQAKAIAYLKQKPQKSRYTP